MIEIYLIRHGETEYNRNTKLIGGRSSFLPINGKGKKQASQLGEWKLENNIRFDKVYCSTAIRAKETLAFMLGESPSEPIFYAENLEELSQGDWEGSLRSKIYTDKRLKQINANNYSFKAPNGESQEEVENRMYSFVMEQIIEQENSGVFLILSHGMAIKCLLRKILGFSPDMTYKIRMDNTGITKLQYDSKKGWVLHYINRRA